MVSFRIAGWKYRNAIRTVIFDGARNGQADLCRAQGLGADLSNVTVE